MWIPSNKIGSETTIDIESLGPPPCEETENIAHSYSRQRTLLTQSKSIDPRLAEITEAIPHEDKWKPNVWLTLKDNKQYEELYSFLSSQTSSTAVIVVCSPLTLIFAFYFFEIFLQSTTLGVFTVILRFIRFATYVFPWLYLYFIKRGDTCSLKKAVLCGDLFMLLSSATGAIALISRCMEGVCDDDQLEVTCNPRHEDNGMPVDTLVANLFMIALFPVVFKSHKSSFILVSYIFTFVGILVAIVIARATADALLMCGCLLSFGMVIYDHERNMITMFLLIQNQQSYYDRLLAGERAKATAEIEKDELRNLIGSVAHDLKTPLHALMGELDGLQAEVNAIKQQLIGLTLLQSPAVTTHTNMITARSAEAQNYIDSLRDIYQFMVMAINRAIEFRKTAAGLSLLASNETFHLSKAVEWAVDRFSNNPSGVPIRVEMSPVLHECCPFLITDKHWMTENILTLLSNACKFTSKGEIVLRISIVVKNIPRKMVRGFSNLSNSVVTFDTTLEPEKHATAGWMADNPSEEYEVRVEVEDSGIGVQDDAVQNLFRPFGQCQRRAGGTGLGLFSLSKRTEVLNGRCGMHRRVDGGSGCCFWFTFPYLPDSNCWNDGITTSEPGSTISTHKPEGNPVTSLQTKAQLELLQKSGSRRRSAEIFCKRDDAKTSSNVVLVVDDSALILKTTSRMLVKEGFEVETAQNGVEGLQLMRSNSYFFVLSDIQMPIMDGLEMAQRIRQVEKDEDRHPHHIVGMSANSDAETRDDSLASGMNAFIPKPVRVNELLNHLATMAPS